MKGQHRLSYPSTVIQVQGELTIWPGAQSYAPLGDIQVAKGVHVKLKFLKFFKMAGTKKPHPNVIPQLINHTLTTPIVVQIHYL